MLTLKSIASFLLCLIIFSGLQCQLPALSASTPAHASIDSLFICADPANLSTEELKQLSLRFSIRSFVKFDDREKSRITAVLQKLFQNHPDEIVKITRGEKVRIFRTHDALTTFKNLNTSKSGRPQMQTNRHDVVISDDYLTYIQLDIDSKLFSSIAHELGHIADEENCISLDHEWLNEELPKLAKFRQLLDAQSNSKTKVADNLLAKEADLPSAYAGRSPSEDFAESFAAFICNPTKTFSARELLVQKLLNSVSPRMQEAFNSAIQATRAADKGGYDMARSKIDNAIALAPDAAALYLDRVRFHGSSVSDPTVTSKNDAERLNDLLKAREIFERNKVPDYDSNLQFISRRLARIYYGSREFSKQKEELLKIIDSDPTDADSLANLGDCYLALHDLDNATTYADRAVNADETYAPAYRLRARVLTAAGKYENALKDLKLALLLEPHFEWALFQESKCLYQLGRFNAARDVIMELLAVNPKHLDATYTICLLDYYLDNYDLAMEEADHANALEHRFNVDVVKARCLVKLKRYSEAKDLITQVIPPKFNNDISNAEPYICLAECELASNDKAKALEHLNQAMKFPTASTLVSKRMKELGVAFDAPPEPDR